MKNKDKKSSLQKTRLKFQPLVEQCQKYNEIANITTRRPVLIETENSNKNNISKKFRFPLLINQIKKANQINNSKNESSNNPRELISTFSEDLKEINSNSLAKYIDSSSEDLAICEVKPTCFTPCDQNYDFFNTKSKSPLVKELKQILGEAKTAAMFKSLDKVRGSLQESQSFKGKIIQIDECYGVRVVTVLDELGNTKLVPERCFANIGFKKRELVVGCSVEGFLEKDESFVYEVNKVFIS